jgi:hypothetical protein
LHKKKSSPVDLQFENSYYVEFDVKHKLDAVWHITSSLHPKIVEIVMVYLESRFNCAKYIKYLFVDCVICIDKEVYSLFTIDAQDLNFPTTSNMISPNKTLVILFDVMIP